MVKIKVINGDLYIFFKENKYDALICYQIDNGVEIDFYNDDLVQIILPNFESQFNRGSLENVPIECLDIQINEDRNVVLSIKIFNNIHNINFSISSIIHKTYI